VVSNEETEKEANVKGEAEKLHQEAERRLQQSSQEIDRLKIENDKLQATIDASKARQPSEEDQLQNLQNKIVDSNQTASKLMTESEKLKQSEALAKQKEASEDNALMASAGQDERCVEWTTKLEAKLKHVLQGKKDDANLCHNSILGLHKERMALKDGNAKMHAEFKNLKKKAAESQKQGDDTLAELNSCLGR